MMQFCTNGDAPLHRIPGAPEPLATVNPSSAAVESSADANDTIGLPGDAGSIWVASGPSADTTCTSRP